MFDCRINLILSLAMIVLCRRDGICQESKDLTRAKLYFEMSKEPFPYVCAIFGERTEVYPNDNESNFRETWFLHSYSPKLNIHRHDHMDQSETTSTGYTALPMLELTMFLRNGKEFKQYLGARPRKPPEKADPLVPQSGVWTQTYFEPMAVPLIGFGCINQPTIQYIGALDKLVGNYRLVEEETLDGLCVQRYSNSRTIPVFDRVTFDERAGGMPVNVLRSLVQNGKDTIRERITTKWTKVGERWLPISTEAEPKLRSLTSQWKVRFHWMLKDIPDAVFVMDSPQILRAKQLKDMAVEQWNAQMVKK
ncbi:MAG: hypothetical protein ABL921_00870 [Pirellula sp.]